MRVSSPVTLAAVCAAVATGLFCSAAVLDRATVGDGSVRVAFLPAVLTWFGFVLMAFFGTWAVRRLAHLRRQGASDVDDLSTLLPTLALFLLALPYLPWLADRVPALQMLAGPFRFVVWAAVMAQLAWTGWCDWRRRPAGFLASRAWPRGVATALVAVSALTIFGVPAARLTGTVLFPAGDEPHYLVIAQSLWRDGDLKIENNHRQGDYHEYFATQLDPHYLTRGADGEIYSIHPVGMPVLIAPIYAIGGYKLVVLAMIAAATAATTLMWGMARLALAQTGAPTFAWAAVVLTAPFLLNTFTVYPEIPAALAVVLAFLGLVRLGPTSTTLPLLGVGLAAATLPWLSTKYAPMSAALMTAAGCRVWFTSEERPRVQGLLTALPQLAVLAAPYAIALAGWFAFFDVYWGKPMPQAPYGSLVQTELKNIVFGLPGLLFDQEYGLLAYAPVYVLAGTGLVAMWRSGHEPRRRAIEIVLVFTALLMTVGAFRIWWGGSASPGRPISSGLPLLLLPMAYASAAASGSLARRAGHHLLLAVSVAISGFMIYAQDGFLISNGRDGTSSLLEYLSPLWASWRVVPSFIHHEASTAMLHVAAWLLVAGVAAVVLGRVRTTSAGVASLAALGTLSTALIVAVGVTSVLPASPPQRELNLQARARLAGLDRFDAHARPLGIRYDAFRREDVRTLASMLTLTVAPGLRSDPQPVRVLYNGRFSLPAGRYRADFSWSDRSGPGPHAVSLQIGRIGRPLEGWSLAGGPGTSVSQEFMLPVDASFVAFRGDTEVERAIAAITITPLEVVDAGERPVTPPVLAASRYANTLVLFHDEQLFPEAGGFWTSPGRAAEVTFARDGTAGPLPSLRLRPGPTPTRTRLRGYGWEDAVSLTPGTTSDVALPTTVRAVLPLQIETSDGFVPAEIDPASRDHRKLGAWVEVVR